jgi:hypothetical protein
LCTIWWRQCFRVDFSEAAQKIPLHTGVQNRNGDAVSGRFSTDSQRSSQQQESQFHFGNRFVDGVVSLQLLLKKVRRPAGTTA